MVFLVSVSLAIPGVSSDVSRTNTRGLRVLLIFARPTLVWMTQMLLMLAQLMWVLLTFKLAGLAPTR